MWGMDGGVFGVFLGKSPQMMVVIIRGSPSPPRGFRVTNYRNFPRCLEMMWFVMKGAGMWNSALGLSEEPDSGENSKC